MSRLALYALVLGSTLGACGTKFVTDAAGGASGTGATSGSAGAGAVAGEAEGGSAGSGAIAGSSRAGNGGTPEQGGQPGLAGSAGTAGIGGLVEPTPEIPRVGLALWLRADEGVVRQGNVVQRWLDQSGNKRDVVQSPGDSRPTYDPSGLNGRPTVIFDGKYDYLEFETPFDSFKNGLTAFIVTTPAEAPESCWSIIELSNGSEVDDIAIGAWEKQWLYEVEIPFIHKGDVASGTPALVNVVHRVAGTADLRVSGALQGSDSFPLPKEVERTLNYVGRSLYQECGLYRGSISEIILYSRAIGALEQRNIETYLNGRWALATPVPAP